jgi:hypothetical protein
MSSRGLGTRDFQRSSSTTPIATASSSMDSRASSTTRSQARTSWTTSPERRSGTSTPMRRSSSTPTPNSTLPVFTSRMPIAHRTMICSSSG